MRLFAATAFLLIMVPVSALAQQRIGTPEDWLRGMPLSAPAPDGPLTMSLDIGTDGKVSSCKVVYTTLRRELSERVCAHLKQNAHYLPAGRPDGTPVTGLDALSISFRAGGFALVTDFGGAVPANSPGSWVTEDDYTEAARQRRSQGNAAVSFAIGADGRVNQCTLTHSSGDPTLDAQTCALIVRRARFKVPLSPVGAPLPVKGRTYVKWALSH